MKRYKHTHISSCKLPVSQLNSNLLFLTNQSSALFLLGLSQSVSAQMQTILPELTDTAHSHHLYCPGHSFPAHQVLNTEGTLLASEITPTSLCGPKIMSLPDR